MAGSTRGALLKAAQIVLQQDAGSLASATGPVAKKRKVTVSAQV